VKVRTQKLAGRQDDGAYTRSNDIVSYTKCTQSMQWMSGDVLECY
jgi:hypothetical protein